MLASQCVKSNKNCCAEFEPEKDMHDRMTSAILYGDKQQESQKDNTSVDAVSYTHLDVYKRQHLYTIELSINIVSILFFLFK